MILSLFLMVEPIFCVPSRLLVCLSDFLERDLFFMGGAGEIECSSSDSFLIDFLENDLFLIGGAGDLDNSPSDPILI